MKAMCCALVMPEGYRIIIVTHWLHTQHSVSLAQPQQQTYIQHTTHAYHTTEAHTIESQTIRRPRRRFISNSKQAVRQFIVCVAYRLLSHIAHNIVFLLVAVVAPANNNNSKSYTCYILSSLSESAKTEKPYFSAMKLVFVCLSLLRVWRMVREIRMWIMPQATPHHQVVVHHKHHNNCNTNKICWPRDGYFAVLLLCREDRNCNCLDWRKYILILLCVCVWHFWERWTTVEHNYMEPTLW